MFNYEQSIWGRGTASLRWSDPTSFRLREALESIKSLKSIKSKVGETSPRPLLCEGEVALPVKILEIGCGAGQFIRAIKKLRPELVCYGCDISNEAITKAKFANDGVDYSLCEAKKLPYADGSVDAVLVFDVLEHAEDPNALIAEIRRVLKPGGSLYCFVPCEGDSLSLWNWLRRLGVGGDLTKKYAGHINYFSRQSLLNLFNGEFWQILRIHYSEHFLGQLLGIAAFFLMDRAAKKRGTHQLNNETYFSSGKQGTARQLIKSIVNGLVYLESSLLKRLPSPNAHIAVKKIQD